MFRPILALGALALTALPATADTAAAGLDGAWASIACEVRPQPNADGTMGEWWLTRAIEIRDNTIAAEFTTYAGPGCGTPLQILSFGGRIDVLGPNPILDGAVSADLTVDGYVRITPLAQGFADFLNGSSACGTAPWEVGAIQDVQESGCDVLGLPSGNVTVEYEVLATDGDHIYFGARPTDGTFITSPDKRPQALLVPAKRVN